MAAGFGTLAVSDLLKAKNQNVLDFGEQRAFDYIRQALDAYNALTAEQLDLLVEPTTERIVGYGGSLGVQMVEANEFGRADASKGDSGSNMGFPLKLKQASLQWTRKWLENNSPAELAALYLDAQAADTNAIQAEIKTAFFRSASYTFKDKLVDNYGLPVKALANADGMALPPGPNGEAFDGSTHTHYLANATLTAAFIDAVVNTVVEHWKRGQVLLLINSAQEGTVRGLNATGQFTPINPVEIVAGANVTIGAGSLDTTQLYNRQVGYWGNQAARVWVKPWVPAGYIAAVILGAGRKPLAWRTRKAGGGLLVMQADNEQYPLRASTLEREYGIGVQDRVAAAVGYIGGGSYVDPTF